MTRPRRVTEDRVSTAVRLPRGLHQLLVEAAEDRDLSVNWLVTRALDDFLSRLVPADEIRLTRTDDDVEAQS